MKGKQLSDRQAQRCEEAIGDVCHCRCGGAFHGAKRGGTAGDGTIDRAFFETLPKDDPHYLPSAAAKRLTKEIKRLERQIANCERLDLQATADYYRKELAVLKGLSS